MTPADKIPAVTAMEADWLLSRTLLGGTRAMRAAGKTYLPQWPNEDGQAYEARLATAVLFPAYARTISTLSGKPFSKALTINDAPAQVEEWLQDCDQQGRNLHAFAADVMECALGMGLCGILVDYPQADGVRTLADERSLGLRPYFVHIKPEQILGWRTERIAGATVLTQLRLMESAEVDDGEFGSKTIEQVRVLERGSWRVYRENERKEWALFAEGRTTLDVIPFVPVYGERLGFMTAKPPLIELAHLNVAHWQSGSDQQTILHVARVPILTVIGTDDQFKLTVGASAAVALPQGGDMKFVEHSGAAIEAGRQDLQDLEERMRQAGAELLVLAPGKVTATQTNTENAVGMCALQRIVMDLQDALNQAIGLMARWVGAESTATVEIFKDFAAATLAEASAQLLLQGTQAGVLSKATWRAEMKRRGILAADVDEDEERERIEADGPALGLMQEA